MICLGIIALCMIIFFIVFVIMSPFAIYNAIQEDRDKQEHKKAMRAMIRQEKMIRVREHYRRAPQRQEYLPPPPPERGPRIFLWCFFIVICVIFYMINCQ